MKKLLSLIAGSIAMLSLTANADFVKTTQSDKTTLKSVQTLTDNGAWCWFSDPRVISYNNKTYTGWVTTEGDIVVAQRDEKTNEVKTVVAHAKFERDDHDNPAFLVDKDGYIFVFYARHSENEGLYMRKSKAPESIDFGPVQMIKENSNEIYNKLKSTRKGKVLNHYTYVNPFKLSQEPTKTFLYWRGLDYKPNFSVSEDNGKTWSQSKIVFHDKSGNGRPYVKYCGNGKDKIHIFPTDQHPDAHPLNSLYYFYYKNGAFYNAAGKLIRDIDNLPIIGTEADVVYDASIENARAWVWDVAEDENGNAVVAYTKFPGVNPAREITKATNHIYCIARWNGQKWVSEDLVNAGSWFPQTREGEKETQPFYSAGLSIDKNNTNIVYLSVSRNGIWEIEKWTKNGDSWEIEPITKDSKTNNVRPYAAPQKDINGNTILAWMNFDHYIYFGKKYRYKNYEGSHYKSSIKMGTVEN